MKKVLIRLISLYQTILSPLLHQVLGVQNACRYSVSCSEYAKHSVQKYGIIRGGRMSMGRLVSCQPFGK